MPQSKQQKQQGALARLERDLAAHKSELPIHMDSTRMRLEMEINSLKRKLSGVRPKFIPWDKRGEYTIENYLDDIQGHVESEL